MKNIFKIIAIILAVTLAVLGIMYVLDLVGGSEVKDMVLKVLEIGGIMLLLSIIVALVSKDKASNI